MRGLFRLTVAADASALVAQWIDAQTGELGVIARTWLTSVSQQGGDVRVVMHDGCPTACVDDAAFAYVGVFTGHVTVGFFQGAALPDPARLLQGTGAYMRHVKIVPGRSVDRRALAALITTAYDDIVARIEAEA